MRESAPQRSVKPVILHRFCCTSGSLMHMEHAALNLHTSANGLLMRIICRLEGFDDTIHFLLPCNTLSRMNQLLSIIKDD